MNLNSFICLGNECPTSSALAEIQEQKELNLLGTYFPSLLLPCPQGKVCNLDSANQSSRLRFRNWGTGEQRSGEFTFPLPGNAYSSRLEESSNSWRRSSCTANCHFWGSEGARVATYSWRAWQPFPWLGELTNFPLFTTTNLTGTL